jgi:hypothetical protein
MFVNANHLDNIVREINAQIRYGIMEKLNVLVLYMHYALYVK